MTCKVVAILCKLKNHDDEFSICVPSIDYIKIKSGVPFYKFNNSLFK